MRAKPFLVSLAASLILAIAGIAALPKLGLARPSSEAAWTEDLYVQKTRIAVAITAPRILAVGGSSTLFSFDTRLASKVIGKPVVNFGTHAGLGVDYILDRAARVMRRGDIVVLVPEYEFLQQPAEANQFAVQLAVFDPHFIAEQSFYEKPSYWFGYGVLPSLVEGLKWLFRGPPQGRSDIRLDELGNVRGNSVALSKGGALAAESPALPVPPITRAAVASLRKFMANAKAEGIRVLVMPPALISTPGYRSPGFRRFQDGLPALFTSLGMIPVGSARDAFLAPQDMYDTVYHANDRGRAAYTARMLYGLCQKMACAHER